MSGSGLFFGTTMFPSRGTKLNHVPRTAQPMPGCREAEGAIKAE